MSAEQRRKKTGENKNDMNRGNYGETKWRKSQKGGGKKKKSGRGSFDDSKAQLTLPDLLLEVGDVGSHLSHPSILPPSPHLTELARLQETVESHHLPHPLVLLLGTTTTMECKHKRQRAKRDIKRAIYKSDDVNARFSFDRTKSPFSKGIAFDIIMP